MKINKLMRMIILLLLVPFIAHSQSHKQYSGEFPNSYNDKYSTANYSYYEDANLEIIKDGKFVYNYSNPTKSHIINIKGNYKNGLRNGEWIFRIILKNNQLKSGSFSTGGGTLKGNYLNGYPNGKWSYSENISLKEKYLQAGKIIYKTKKEKPTKMNIEFKNGKIINNYAIEINSLAPILVKGQANNESEKIGRWTIKDGQYWYELNYNNGILNTYNQRELNGNPFTRITNSQNMTTAKSDYQSGKITYAELQKKYNYVIDTLYDKEYSRHLEIMYQTFCNAKNISGDLLYDAMTENEIIRYYPKFYKFLPNKSKDVEEDNYDDEDDGLVEVEWNYRDETIKTWDDE